MKHGESFERYVLGLMHRDGYELMAKTDPPVRVVRWTRGHNQFTGCFLEEGFLDLTGSINGWHVEVEVKDCKGVRFPFSKIRPHQLRRMADLCEDGALAGLALRLRGARADDDHVVFIPAWTLLGLVKGEKKSVTWKDLEVLVADGLVLEHTYRERGSMKKFFKLMV